MYFNKLLEKYNKNDDFINENVIEIEKLFNNKNKYDKLFKEYYNIVQNNFKDRKKKVKLSLNGQEFSLKINSLIVHMILWKPYLYFKKDFDPKFIIKTNHMDSKVISKYGDMIVSEFLTEENQFELNECLAHIIEELGYISLDFNFYICNTINLYDKIQLAKHNEEYRDLIHTHFDEENQTTEEIEKEMNARSNKLFEILASEDNCFHDYINSGEGCNKGQLTQFEISVGPKPNLQGQVFPKIVNTNFLVNGLQSPSDYFIDASGGRKASIINYKEVKTSGYTTRKLSLLCMNTLLDYDNHDCGSTNYMKVFVDNAKTLTRLNGRWYNDGEKDILIHANDEYLIGQTINLRSPITCCSHNGKICRKCYGELSKINNNIHVGILGVTYLTSQLTQSMLSAKHLLKTNSEKIEWSEDFLKFFNVSSNSISVSQDLENASQFSIVINDEDINESGDSEFNSSIKKFSIIQRAKDKKYIIPIVSEKELFLSDYFVYMLDYKGVKDEDGNKVINLKDFEEEETLFYIEIENNELSKYLHSILNLIDNKEHLDIESKDELLQKFLELLNEAGIFVDSVHIENIVREIIRSTNNITKRPDWTQENPDYQILRVSDAITNSDSIIISLSFEKIKRQLYEPETYEKVAPSVLDNLFK